MYREKGGRVNSRVARPPNFAAGADTEAFVGSPAEPASIVRSRGSPYHWSSHLSPRPPRSIRVCRTIDTEATSSRPSLDLRRATDTDAGDAYVFIAGSFRCRSYAKRVDVVACYMRIRASAGGLQQRHRQQRHHQENRPPPAESRYRHHGNCRNGDAEGLSGIRRGAIAGRHRDA